MAKRLSKIDAALLNWDRKHSETYARAAIFIIFFWFGLLKVLGVSPAGALVAELLNATMPFIPAELFIPLFGLVEMVIGLFFIIPRYTRTAILLLALHMVTTVLPVILLPEVTWQAPGVLTLEGQYIVKNVALVTLAMMLGLRIKPLNA